MSRFNNREVLGGGQVPAKSDPNPPSVILPPPTMPFTLLGINEGFIDQAKPTDWARDLWHSSSFRGLAYQYDTEPVTGTLHRTVDGAPTNYFPGETAIYWIISVCRTNPARAGTYTINYPPGMTMTMLAAAGVTIVQPFSEGTAKVNLPQKALGEDGSVTFRVSGPIPAEGIRISMTKDGENATGIWTQHAIDALAALGKINRSMTARSVNGDNIGSSPDGKRETLRTAATRYRGPVIQGSAYASGPMCVEMQLEAANRAGQHFWHNQSHIDDDSVVAVEAAIVATNLAADKACFVELGNEDWNLGFRQTKQIKCMGVRAGLAPVGATPGSLVPEDVIFNDSPSNSSVTNYPCAVGDKIFMAINGIGFMVFQCLVAQPAGVTIPATGTKGPTSDGNWSMIYDHGDCIRAACRWIAKRSKEVWAIWDAAFAAVGRPRPFRMIGHQFGVPLNHANAHNAQWIMDWDETWRVVDRVTVGSYWGGGTGAAPNELGAYATNYASPTYPHPWTATEKALAASDPAAFRDAFFAIAPDAVDSAVGQFAALKSQLSSYLLGKGRAADEVKLNSYESNWHVIMTGWPAGLQAAVGARYAELIKDARFADMLDRHVKGLMALGGEHVLFDRCGPLSTVYGRAYWGFQEHDLDFSSRFRTVAALVAGTELQALTLSAEIPAANVPWSATIGRNTAGSSLSATSSDGTVLTVTKDTGSGAFVVSGTFPSGGKKVVTLREKLAGAAVATKLTDVEVTVSAPAFIQPYNSRYILGPGDSRTASARGLTGTYGVSVGIGDDWVGGFDSYLAAMMGHTIRGGSSPNAGIGGQTAAYALAYPRPLGATPFGGRIDSGTVGIAGNTMTLTSLGGGAAAILPGCIVSPPGGTPCAVLPYGTNGTTGTGGLGTYAVDGPAQNIAASTNLQISYVVGQAPKRTIADIAANEAAIIVLGPVGTNSAGSAGELAAVDQAIRGLTDPTYSYPGYGGPLPLYQGRAKTVVLLNETRRGITASNTVNNQNTGATAIQFANYARTLKRYSFDSGDPAYANSRVVVVDLYDDPLLADLSDTVTCNPLPGLFADGLHPAPPALFRAAKVVANRLKTILSTTANFARLPTTDNAATFISANPCFTPATGGTTFMNGHTLTGTIPSGWRLITNAGSGLAFDVSTVPLGGNLGNEVVIKITGTPSADNTITFDQIVGAAGRSGVDLSADTLRAVAKINLTVSALNSLYRADWGMVLSTSGTGNSMGSAVGAVGTKLGYGNNAAFPLWLKNGFADVSHGEAIPFLTKNVSLAPYGATGNPTTLTMAYTLTLVAGVATDITLRISQAGIFKAID